MALYKLGVSESLLYPFVFGAIDQISCKVKDISTIMITVES